MKKILLFAMSIALIFGFSMSIVEMPPKGEAQIIEAAQALPSNPDQFELVPSAKYRIRNVGSDKYLQFPAAGAATNASLTQQTLSDSPLQVFAYEYLSGKHRLYNYSTGSYLIFSGTNVYARSDMTGDVNFVISDNSSTIPRNTHQIINGSFSVRMGIPSLSSASGAIVGATSSSTSSPYYSWYMEKVEDIGYNQEKICYLPQKGLNFFNINNATMPKGIKIITEGYKSVYTALYDGSTLLASRTSTLSGNMYTSEIFYTANSASKNLSLRVKMAGQQPADTGNCSIIIKYPTNTQTVPETDPTIYNCAVRYQYKVQAGDYVSDKLSISKIAAYNPDYSNIVENGFIELTRPYAERADCLSIFNIRGYSTFTRVVSNSYKAPTDDVSNSKYIVVASTDRGTTRAFPTSWDQERFIWPHGASRFTTIYGTMVYNGLAKDISVKIPLLGTATSSVTIDGVKFELRTGPNQCSIRTTSSGIQTSDTYHNKGATFFAFGTVLAPK